MAEAAAGEDQDGKWNLGVAIRQADDFVNKTGLPSVSRPSTWGKQYEFPEDLPGLSTTELGRWQGRMERLWAYGAQVLAREASELDEFEKLYELSVAQRMYEESAKHSGRGPVKDVLRAVAIKSDPRLEALTQSLVARRLRVRRLTVQVDIYKSHLVRLSREQSRREAEARLG